MLRGSVMNGLPFLLDDVPWDAPPTVLFDDGIVVVANKAPGLVSTGTDELDRPSVEAAVSAALGRQVFAVHRLDRGTSGVQLLTSARDAIAPLHAALVHATACKEYLAWVHGECSFDACDVDAAIGPRVDAPGTLGVVDGGRPARSRVTVLERRGGLSMVRVRLLSGRTHQVRIHMAHLGHPLVGEPWYGPAPCELAPRPVLHAATLLLPAWRPDAAWHAPVPWRVAAT